MLDTKQKTRSIVFCLAAAALTLVLFAGLACDRETEPCIVQAGSAAEAAALVESAGGAVNHELGIINAVTARLTAEQRERLAATPRVTRIWDDTPVRTTATAKTVTIGDGAGKGKGGGNANGNTSQLSGYPMVTRADRLHDEAITGDGIGIAILDSGIWKHEQLLKDDGGQSRLVAIYDARIDRSLRLKNATDTFGHGSHVASVAASSVTTSDGGFNGIAPRADLISVQVFDDQGAGTYADVIRGIDWVVANRNAHNIRVLNCSFSATPRSYYWDDPLNQAVMRAWQAGIVVVASAGNNGPEPMTIGVPGNVPYVVTVGALTDSYTFGHSGDDLLASFSSAGPTHAGFVKPEVLAPGGHMLGLMDSAAALAKQHPQFHDGGSYFTMSGTSQSAAVVSGVAALLLEREPYLTPDDVKCKLMASARTALNDDGSPAYSFFQQGAGAVDAYGAAYETELTCANRGLDIASDLDGTQHFAGQARWDPLEGYAIAGLESESWDGSLAQPGSIVWGGSIVWDSSLVWGESVVWGGSIVWGDSIVWGGSIVWDSSLVWGESVVWGGSLSDPMSVDVWVPQE